MQGLLDPPRQAFTTRNVLDALAWGPVVYYDAGYELLDGLDNPLLDLSQYLTRKGSSVSRDCNAGIQGTCTLITEYAHNWGVDRVRPYYLIGSPLVPLGPIRFDLGVYVVTTPGQPLGQQTPQYGATGYDKNYFLNQSIGDAYNIDLGTSYFAAILAVIAAAGGGSHVILEPTKSAATLPAARTWSVADAATTTWLTVVNSLLSEISYRPIWVDQNGYYRSEPYVDPASRATELIMGGGNSTAARYVDAAYLQHTVISPGDRSINRDSWNHPNWWRFVQAGLTFSPTEGAGQYTVANLTGGPTSQTGVGRVIKAPVQLINASGQADLQAQGDRIVAQSVATAESLSFRSMPFPIAGHFDILLYADDTLPGQDQRKLVAQTWSLPLDGLDMTWVADVAQSVDSGLWTAGGTAPRPVNFDPPPRGLGGSYHPPTPQPIPTH